MIFVSFAVLYIPREVEKLGFDVQIILSHKLYYSLAFAWFQQALVFAYDVYIS